MVRSNKQRSRRPRASRRGRSRKLGLGGGSNMQPPPFVPTLSMSHRFRYLSGSNAGTFTITRGNLLNQLLYATSTTTSVRLVEGVRLRQVELWSNPTDLGTAPPAVSIEWQGENSPSTVISDVPMGVRPGHIRSVPPAASSNRWWSMSGTSNVNEVLFALTVPANTVIDVRMDLRLVEAEAPTAGDVPTGATLGQLYGNYLDGLSSGKLTPVGYTVLP